MTYLPGMEELEDSDIMDSVISAMNGYDADSYTSEDVERALYHDFCTEDDFGALLSPAAAPYLEQIAQKRSRRN